MAAGSHLGDNSTGLNLKSSFDPAMVKKLRQAGHVVEMVSGFSDIMGHAGAVVRHPSGVLEGAADPRSDGVVAAI